MISLTTLRRRVPTLAAALGLLAATAVPAVLGPRTVSAAQVTNRRINISTSVVGATGVTYDVQFRPVSSTAIQGIVIDFCQNSPLVGLACDTDEGVANAPGAGSISVAHTGGPYTFNVEDNTGATNKLILTRAAGMAVDTAANVTFSFTANNPTGTSGNPNAPGSFYGRIITFADDADALTYDSSSTGANNPGDKLDDGGVALSTARQLTVEARVQEVLEFCVGALLASENPQNCTVGPMTTGSTTVDLGVIDSTTESVSPVAAANGGNERTGAMIIRTNAFGGAVIQYKAELNAGSGTLKVPSAVCLASDNSTPDILSGSNVDQCFNSAISANDLSLPGEKFGMAVGLVEDLASTDNLAKNLSTYNYDGIDPDGFEWDASGATQQIAASGTVMDYERLWLHFAARAAATTPTGAYSVTSTYIATATF
jgi:hypothetical protein